MNENIYLYLYSKPKYIFCQQSFSIYYFAECAILLIVIITIVVIDNASIVKVRISGWSYRISGLFIDFHHSTVIRICKVQQ